MKESNNADLTNVLLKLGVLETSRIIKAFNKVDRRDFLPASQRHRYLENRPIPIGYEQTNSQPFTVAFMLELLLPSESDKVLDIGSGSGWTLALLSRLIDSGSGGKVFGVEVIPELVELGNSNLQNAGIKNCKVSRAGEKLGIPLEAPFDKILVSAGVDEVAQELIDQLKVGGRMVIPVKQSLLVVEKSESGLKTHEFPGFVFVPLV